MIDVKFNDYTILMPETWDELSSKQLLYLGNNFSLLAAPNYEFQIRFTLKLLDLGIFKFRLQKMLMELSSEQVVLLSNLCKNFFILDKINLHKNKFKVLRIGIQNYYGPLDGLSNLTIAEFSYADKYYANYLKTMDEEWLNKLCGCLYRPKKLFAPSHDVRKEFDSFKVGYYAKKFETQSLALKHAILLWYWGCRNNIAETFKNVFSAEGDTDSSLALGWTNIIFDLSGEKFGTIETTSKANILEVFLYCENEIVKYKNRKKQKI